MSVPFSAADHPRDDSGRFRTKDYADQVGGLAVLDVPGREWVDDDDSTFIEYDAEAIPAVSRQGQQKSDAQQESPLGEHLSLSKAMNDRRLDSMPYTLNRPEAKCLLAGTAIEKWSPRQREQVEAVLRDLWDEAQASPVRVRIDSRVLAKQVLASGRLMNCHETRAPNPERVEYETGTMGVPTTTRPEDLPLYGFAIMPRPHRAYGDVNLVLKEQIKGRCTHTFGDSNYTRARPIHNTETPTADELFAAASLNDTGLPGLYLEDATKPMAHGRFGVDPRPGSTGREWDQTEFLDYAAYVETQIHGGITVNDIEIIEINPWSEPGTEQTLREAFPNVEIRLY